MKEKKNQESLETTCCCIPYCVHRQLITEKTTIFVWVDIVVSTKLSRLLHGHSITSNLFFFKRCSYVRNFLWRALSCVSLQSKSPRKSNRSHTNVPSWYHDKFNLHKFATNYIDLFVFLVTNFTEQFSRLNFRHIVANFQILISLLKWGSILSSKRLAYSNGNPEC